MSLEESAYDRALPFKLLGVEIEGDICPTEEYTRKGVIMLPFRLYREPSASRQNSQE